MTCYFRNSRMIELFEEIGVEITKENRKAIDETLHDLLSVEYPNCAATWKLIRKKLDYDAEGFKSRLKEVLASYVQNPA
jgi:hypothetical protein